MLPESFKLPFTAESDYCFDATNEQLFFVSGLYSSKEDDIEAAAHIAACVNACEGMADPASEMAKLQAHKQILLDVLKHLPMSVLSQTLQKLNQL